MEYDLAARRKRYFGGFLAAGWKGFLTFSAKLDKVASIMPIDLNIIKTIVVVMMENRSFDNLLGYLSLGPSRWKNLEGLQTTPAWLDQVASIYNGAKFPPFLLTDPYDVIDADPPHERDPIAIQMGAEVNGTFPAIAHLPRPGVRPEGDFAA